MGAGQYIWETHLECTGSCGAVHGVPEERGVPDPLGEFILDALFETQLLGYENGESHAVPPQDRPEVEGGGRPVTQAGAGMLRLEQNLTPEPPPALPRGCSGWSVAPAPA